MAKPTPRRAFLRSSALTFSGVLVATQASACGSNADDGVSDARAGDDEPTTTGASSSTTNTTADPDGSTSTTQAAATSAALFSMPAEDAPHERTWMCWPSSAEIWGDDLPDVQDTILAIATAIARFEPVTLLARPAEVASLQGRVGGEITIVEAPVDDLWARDTLPCFLLTHGADAENPLRLGHATFNGWGGKQIHDGDAQLAAVLADHLHIDLTNAGVTGEGGGLEVDGAGTVLAAESCWVNDNRNPGKSRDAIEAALLKMLGADRMLWIDGLAGADITDGHIDTLARFVNDDTILLDKPAYDDPDDPWVTVAATTHDQVKAMRTADGQPYNITTLTQPSTTRVEGDAFLATYMNYYVCNGAVIAPEFGDKAADEAASAELAKLFPDREIVLLNIDALAAGGGGIHCATQQQPKVG